jgi:hypothetical protein
MREVVTMKFAVIGLALLCATPASAQLLNGGGLDFGPIESGVLPNGAEIPDLTLDEIGDSEAGRRPARAAALPPPQDLYGPDAPAAGVGKKKRVAR